MRVNRAGREVDSQIFRLDSGRRISTCRPLGLGDAHIAGGARLAAGRLGDVGHDSEARFGKRSAAAGIVVGNVAGEDKIGLLLGKTEIDQSADYFDSQALVPMLLLTNGQVDAAAVAAGMGLDNARQIHGLQPSLGNGLAVEFGDKAEGGLRDAAVNALDLVERIGRHVRAIGVIQHIGILVPAQQDVPIGVGHGTQVQAGRVQVDGVSVEGHS